MKKKILGLVACLGIALFFAINVSINLSKDHSKNGLVLKNIEALADGEGGSFTCRWATRDQSETQVICIKTGVGNICTCGDVKYYP